MAPLRDFTFVYEGESRVLLPKDQMANPEVWSSIFQGTYAFRQDGAAYLDAYCRQSTETQSHLLRQCAAVFGGVTERLEFRPDQKAGTVKKIPNAAPRALMTYEGSPLRINHVWFFHDEGTTPRDGFADLGYETVEGARCRHVTYDRFPKSRRAGEVIVHYWIDFERGGHPRVVETRELGKTTNRAVIELREVETEDGQTVWFPVSGTYDLYGYDRKLYDRPASRDTIKLVKHSLRINGGLPDSVFSVTKSSLQPVRSPALEAFREEFTNRPVPPKFRSDSKGVQERIDAQMAKALEQGRMLQAPTSPEANWLPWIQAGLAGFGIVIILSALWWRRTRA
jgi:hypothetical protein